MLNLSDKDLDRLSQEAAQHNEPGDIVGPKFWDKLEARLDRDLGKMNPNPARGIRRLPYYYAPAVLVLLGVTYYVVRLNSRSQNNSSSTSPPLTATTPAASPAQAASEHPKPTSLSPKTAPSDKSNSTPTAPSNTVQYPGTAGTPAAGAAPGGAAAADAASRNTASRNTASRNPAPATTATGDNAPATSATGDDAPVGTAASDAKASSDSRTSSRTSSRLRRHRHDNANVRDKSNGNSASANGRDNSNLDPASTNLRNGANGNHTPANIGHAANGSLDPASTADNAAGKPNSATTPRDLTFSAVRGPVRLTRKPKVDDSALLAVNASTIREPIRHHGLRINRSLTFGILAAPDYASVNSLSGQKPGSTIGITADYQFANHWYIGTGLLLSRKIFAAAPQDYHTPPNYYRNSLGIMGNADVDYVKGTFSMLEVPINLRYDFNTGGNILFFVNAGVSSYFFTRENCGYYFNWYNTGYVVDKQQTYTNRPDNLFASLNLSVGAEYGISNSLSVMLAPYYKIPVRNLGFGQIQLSSVGINFAIRFAPVISRKRF